MKKIFILLVLIIQIQCYLFAQKKGEISYQIAKQYFAKNDFDFKSIKQNKITNKEVFEQAFGGATVMGENGKPTEIDFSKNFVIFKVLPETDIDTELIPKTLKETSKNKLTFEYQTKIGNKLTYTMVATMIIIVDNKYQKYDIILKDTK